MYYSQAMPGEPSAYKNGATTSVLSQHPDDHRDVFGITSSGHDHSGHDHSGHDHGVTHTLRNPGAPSRRRSTNGVTHTLRNPEPPSRSHRNHNHSSLLSVSTGHSHSHGHHSHGKGVDFCVVDDCQLRPGIISSGRSNVIEKLVGFLTPTPVKGGGFEMCNKRNTDGATCRCDVDCGKFCAEKSSTTRKAFTITYQALFRTVTFEEFHLKIPIVSCGLFPKTVPKPKHCEEKKSEQEGHGHGHHHH